MNYFLQKSEAFCGEGLQKTREEPALGGFSLVWMLRNCGFAPVSAVLFAPEGHNQYGGGDHDHAGGAGVKVSVR